MMRRATFILFLLLTSATGAIRAEEAGARPAPRQPTGPSFEAFRIVAERNIFNSGRRPQRIDTAETSRPQPLPAERIYLTGAWIHDTGTSRVSVAFFEGSRSEYNASCKLGESVAGHRLTEIRTDGIKLEQSGALIEIPVGGGLSKLGDGKWQLVSVFDSGNRDYGSRSRTGPSLTAASTGSSTGTASSSSSSGGAAGDTLKKLMERRRQQTEK